MSKLVIIESPGKLKSIQKYLGNDYKVMASVGHVRDLPKSKMGVDIENGYTPQYIEMSDKKDVIKKLREAAANSEKVYLATDPDREGEAISWHLAQILALDMKSPLRVCFNEITKNGVETGMKSPREIDLNLVDAQQARRVLDRIVGYKLSPFLWKKVKRGLSAGRVQSVALKLVVDREREIEGFVPEEYWTIDAKLFKQRNFIAKFYGNAQGEKIAISDEEQANKIVAASENESFVVDSIKKGVRKKQPLPPFITSTLQQEAARRLNFTGLRTMRIAQQLYEGIEIEGVGSTGLITYMRTDSLRVSAEASFAAQKYIGTAYGEKYVPKKPRVYKSKGNAQDAHEAIRPTIIELTPEKAKASLTAEQYKLYKLIWERFIASQMENCLQDTVSVDIIAGDYLYKASGYTVKFDGFTVVYDEKEADDEGEVSLPELVCGEAVKCKGVTPYQHFTQPPARYNESTLTKALEENGIGRPSTYAPIISNIVQRDYIEKEKKSFKPTKLGMIVTDIIAEYFKKIVDVKFTAGMEQNLDKIDEGKLSWVETVDRFYKDFAGTLKKAEESMNGVKVKVPDEETEEICENCGRKMVIKSGRFGKFLACPAYPQCKNTKPLPEEKITQPCPKCGGELIKRIAKKTGKKFYGCSQFPKCDFAAPGLPSGETCSECGSYILIGARGRKFCMNAQCSTRTAKKKADKNEN
ncbi:MAG: type I DNA topoisomerase [Acutalibacteraceae bacterium]|nr:type I DNA topoisomerase [Acutalibacteraceae bacterium]